MRHEATLPLICSRCKECKRMPVSMPQGESLQGATVLQNTACSMLIVILLCSS